MSDDRELVERLATIEATPRARWVAELRADLDAAWETGDLGDLDALRRTTVTLVETEPTPSEPSSGRRWTSLIAVAAAVIVVVVGVFVVVRGDDGTPADQPSPTVTVPFAFPPQELPDTDELPNTDELLEPGTYYVDEVDGTPTPRIFVTIGTGWSNGNDPESIGQSGPTPTTYSPEDDVGFITFSRPDRVYLDACHLSDGFHPGPVDTVDGLVAALREQRGWVDVSAPSDISIDGYVGKTFQRTVPEVLSGCPNMAPGHMRLPELGGDGLNSWLNEDGSNFGGFYYEPGQFETLMVLDIDGTVVVIHSNLWAGSSAADRAEFAAVLDSIRIDPRALPNVPNVPGGGPLEPGTYYVDEVSGTPTPRIFATIGTGWRDYSNDDGWDIAKGGPWLGEARFDEFLQHEIGFMAFSNPVAVYADACHWEDGYHPGPVDTLDGLVAALTEQRGWAEVTVPSDISIDGYVGKAFQRTAPADMSDCSTRVYRTRTLDGGLGPHPDFRSWDSADEGGAWFYEPGEVENLWVLDLDGTIVVIETGAWPEPSAGADPDFADAVLDSIRIDRP